MYIVTREGYKLTVDDSGLSEDALIVLGKSVGLYNDNMKLVPV